MTDLYETAAHMLDKVRGSDTMMVAKVVTKVREICKRLDHTQAQELRQRCRVLLDPGRHRKKEGV